MAEWGWTPDASHTRYLTWNLGTMGWLFHHVKFKIKGPDNPTCQLLPISCKRKVKTGWERQKRDRRWRKADCVKQVRTRELRVRELLVRRLCVSKLCVRKCVWVAWRWWKRDCVRVRELYVKELCVKLLCGMCGQRQLRQDHRERSWLQRIVADRLLPGPSWKLTVRRRCLRQAAACHVATGARARWSKWKHTKRKKLSSGAFHWQSYDPRTGALSDDGLLTRSSIEHSTASCKNKKKEEFQIWLEGIKKSRFPWNKSTFQTRYQNPIGCKFRYQMLLQVFI